MMVKQKTWSEFREAGLLFFINQILHAFGWAICFNPDDGTAYPARVKFRGFSEDVIDSGYLNLARYLESNAKELLTEVEEEEEYMTNKSI